MEFHEQSTKKIYEDHHKEVKTKLSMSKEEIEQAEMSGLASALPALGAALRLVRRVGAGTFSAVYEARSRRGRRHAVKHLLPTAHPARVAQELRCLRDIGGKNNVIGVDLCLRNLDTIVIVMPFIPHKRFSEYVRLMDAAETARYMRALLGALKHVHAFGVIHRDVKPANFLYDRERGRYMLVDFGLAQRIVTDTRNGKRRRESSLNEEPPAKRGPGPPRVPVTDVRGVHSPGLLDCLGGSTPAPAPAGCACAGVAGVCAACLSREPPRAPRAGTQGFRPPEVLLKVSAQGTGVDVWAAGVLLAGVLAARAPLLRAAGDAAALAELCAVLGSERMCAAALSLRRRLLAPARRALCLRRALSRLRSPPGPDPSPPGPPAPCGARRVPCVERGEGCVCDDGTPGALIRPGQQWAGFPDAAFALLYELLEPAPRRRPTAAAALTHPFLTDY